MTDSFHNKWYHDVPELLKRADALYAQLETLGKPSKWDIMKKKLYEDRGWLRAKPYIQANLDSALRSTGAFYLTKAMEPGPAYVFPLKDIDGTPWQAQVRPFPDSWLWLPDHKYRLLGTKLHPLVGPRWCGVDDATVRNIIAKRKAMLVEGPFDVLACKALLPGCPVLSTLTKGTTEDHIDYLRILGVKQIVLMFDNEASAQGSKGEAITKWRIENKFASDMLVTHEDCPASDPSDALKNDRNTMKLLGILTRL